MLPVSDGPGLRPLNDNFNLDDDVIHRVFEYVADVDTLKSLILASKLFHTTFKTHPISITRAVTFNVVGAELWSLALRVVRYQIEFGKWIDTLYLNIDLDDSIASGRGGGDNPVTLDECKMLLENARVVQELEKIFGNRHKLRSMRTSELELQESLKFRRALYRIMLYTQTFPLKHFGDTEDKPLEIMKPRIRTAQVRMLEAYPTQELKEMYTVSEFLHHILQSLHIEHSEQLKVFRQASYYGPGSWRNDHFPLIASGSEPRHILDCYQRFDPDSLWKQVLSDTNTSNLHLGNNYNKIMLLIMYFSHAFDCIWTQRNVSRPDQVEHWSSIIDYDIGASKETYCQHCGETSLAPGVHPGSFDRWNNTNWDTLRYSRLHHGIHRDYLIGKLASNHHECKIFERLMPHLTSESNPNVYTTVLTKVFQLKREKFEHWKESDWCCADSIRYLVTHHLHLWLLERKREEGIEIPSENCRYVISTDHYVPLPTRHTASGITAESKPMTMSMQSSLTTYAIHKPYPVDSEPSDDMYR